MLNPLKSFTKKGSIFSSNAFLYLISAFIALNLISTVIFTSLILLDIKNPSASDRYILPESQSQFSIVHLLDTFSSSQPFLSTGIGKHFAEGFEQFSGQKPVSPDSVPLSVQRHILELKNPSSVNSIRTAAKPNRIDILTRKPAPTNFELSAPYFLGLASLAVIPLVLAALAPITCCFFCVGRTCCGCFGGWSKKKVGYPKSHIYKFKVFYLVVIILLLIPSFVGIAGNAKFQEGFKTFFKDLRDILNGLLDDIRVLEDAIQSFANATIAILSNNTIDVPSFPPVIDDAGKEIKVKVDEVEAQAFRVENYRSSAIISSMVFSIILAAVGAFSLLTGITFPLLFVGFISWLATSIYWIAFAIHYPLAVLSSDLCVAFVDKGYDSIKHLLPCSSIFNKTTHELRQTLEVFIDNLETLRDNFNANGQTTQANQVQVQIDSSIKARDTLIKFASCSFIFTFIEKTHNALCFKMLDGFINIAISQVLIASISIIFILGSFKGMKRLNKNSVRSLNVAGTNDLDESINTNDSETYDSEFFDKNFDDKDSYDLEDSYDDDYKSKV